MSAEFGNQKMNLKVVSDPASHFDPTPPSQEPAYFPPSGENPELDVLFQASRNVEGALLRERQKALRLQTDLGALQKRWIQEQQNFQLHLKSMKEKLDLSEKSLSAVKSREQKLQNEKESLQNRLDSIERETQDLQQKSKNEIQISRAKTEGLRQTYLQMEQEHREQKSALQRLRIENDSLRAQNLELRHRLEILETEHVKLKRSTETSRQTTQDSLYRAQLEAKHFQSKWLEAEQIKTENKIQKTQIESLTQQLQNLQSKLGTQLLQSREALLRSQSDDSSRKEPLESELRRLREKNLELERELQEAQDQVGRYAQEIALLKSREKSAKPESLPPPFRAPTSPKKNREVPPQDPLAEWVIEGHPLNPL